jgi:hypothetical protein
MLFLFLGLKVPLLALCWLVWWAIKQSDDGTAEDPGGDGGSKQPHPHPPAPLPRAPPTSCSSATSSPRSSATCASSAGPPGSSRWTR